MDGRQTVTASDNADDAPGGSKHLLCFRSLVPEAINIMVVRARNLKYRVLGPSEAGMFLILELSLPRLKDIYLPHPA